MEDIDSRGSAGDMEYEYLRRGRLSRRNFLKGVSAGALLSLVWPQNALLWAAKSKRKSDLFWVRDIPDDPFGRGGLDNRHTGVDSLLQLMGKRDLKFYRSAEKTTLGGPQGMIAPDDVVLIKVNAQWKHKGCTNSDLVRGLIQRILDHPDGFVGEVVMVENGQGRGSLDCDTSYSYGGDSSVQANANDTSHSFLYLVDSIFRDPRVSAYLLDPIRGRFIDDDDHTQDGYRIYENVSYPCFTTAGGNRVELRKGIWNGQGYEQNMKLINVPVLKHHDTGGSEITAALKHFYGLVSMSDGQSGYRHYPGLGETCGKMIVSVRTPVLNIIDAIWVSHKSLAGYPSDTTVRMNQILASQDPVALDYWAARYILYPIDGNRRHHPNCPGIKKWLKDAKKTINSSGGLYDKEAGIFVKRVRRKKKQMKIHEVSL